MVRSYPSIACKFGLLLCAAAVLFFPAGTAAQEKGDGVAPAGLSEELQGMRISDVFIPLLAESVGTIQSLKGRLVVRHGDTARAYYAAPGNQLYENDSLFTLKDSRCRVKFITDDIITMGANSRIRVDQLADDRSAWEKRSVFSMFKGKAMFYALRLFRYKKVTAEVRTPTAVAGIRGTKFGVEVGNAEIKQVSAGPAYTANASGSLPPGSLAKNNLGEGFRTTVYGFDGEVQVAPTDGSTPQIVGAGETVTVGLAGTVEVTPTPPDTARQFALETGEAGGAAAGGDGSGDAGTGEAGGAATGDINAYATAGSAEAGAADLNQNLTTQTIQQSVVSGARVGYFSALLTRYDGGSALADIYTNSTRADFNSDQISGNSIVDPVGFAVLTGIGTQDESYIKQIKTGAAFDSGDLGTTRPMDNPDNFPGWPNEDLPGESAYMEWGFWRMSDWVPGDDTTPTYAITDRAYYVCGVVTPDAAAAGIVGTYAGSAWGTYFNADGGIDMTGGFTCDVNVPAGSVSGFDLAVSGSDGMTAEIIDGTGSFVGSSGEFEITGGSWYLNEAPAVYKSLSGSLYGSAGEQIGGAWAMGVGADNNAAVGIFVGDK